MLAWRSGPWVWELVSSWNKILKTFTKPVTPKTWVIHEKLETIDVVERCIKFYIYIYIYIYDGKRYEEEWETTGRIRGLTIQGVGTKGNMRCFRNIYICLYVIVIRFLIEWWKPLKISNK